MSHVKYINFNAQYFPVNVFHVIHKKNFNLLETKHKYEITELSAAKGKSYFVLLNLYSAVC